MIDISQLLVQFVFRLTFGVAAAMALTNSAQVSSGFYRVHLWVLMGLNTLAALALYSRADDGGLSSAVIASVAVVLLSYVGSAIWLYERPRAGVVMLALVAAAAWGADVLAQPPMVVLSAAEKQGELLATLSQMLSFVTAAAVLGTVLTAMFLGHWYLTNPGMKMAPLQRLLLLAAAAIGARTVLSGAGLAWAFLQSADPQMAAPSWGAFLALRWLAGLLLPAGLLLMTKRTLDIPNTQSATGILYAAVVLVFIGELSSQVLSAEMSLPL